MNIFITGGTGFVGSSVVSDLLLDHHVFVHYRNTPLRIKNKRLHMLKADLESEEDIYRVLMDNKIDMFINLIGIIKEKGDNTFKKLHYEYVLRLIKVSKRAKIKRFIQMSALGANEGIDTGYFKYKEEGEKVVIGSGIEYTIIRPSMIFGEGDDSIMFFREIINRFHVFPLFGMGNYELQPVSIGDVSELFRESVGSDRYLNKIVEIAGPKRYSFKGLLKYLAMVDGAFLITIPIPIFLSKLIALIGDRIDLIPINTGQLKMLLAGSHLKKKNNIVMLKQKMGREELS